MPYIKKLIMKGFKSFAQKTELPFSEDINVILGPNGSGKSNISDAICFVLGRLNTKSLRAAKASNLIFRGTKEVGASKEASVEMIFDNSDKTFSLESLEISIKRIVRRNGQSIYQINNETKNRQEVLALLAQAGIDPNGFNIVLQGEIQNFVNMHGEERRKIIEEVAGIAVYELRKEKSLKELEKTEAKLKEVTTVLRERTNYMNNLEKERQQALKFKKIEETIKRHKASITHSDLNLKKDEFEKVSKEVSEKLKEKEKIKKEMLNIEGEIKNLEFKISEINADMQKATGLEQEKLNDEIAGLRADLAGMKVNLDNNKNKILELTRQKQSLRDSIDKVLYEIKNLEKETPTTSKQQKEVEQKKEELEKMEIERKKFYMTRSELKSTKDRLSDKQSLLANYENETEFFLKQTQSLSKDLYDRKTDAEKVNSLKNSLKEKREILENIKKEEAELGKLSFSNENEIEGQEKIISKISKLDICPLCKSKITPEHIQNIGKEIDDKINELREQIKKSDQRIDLISQKKQALSEDIEQMNIEIQKREKDLVIISSIEEKKNQIKNIQEKIEILKKEISELDKKRELLETKINENPDIERKYEELRLSIKETGLVNAENLNAEIGFKQRDLDRFKSSLKAIDSTEDELKEEISELNKKIVEKESTLEKKRKQENELTEKFKKMIDERDKLQAEVRNNQIENSRKQNLIYNLDQAINNLRIDEARVKAEISNLETEMLEFSGVELIRASKESLIEKLAELQQSFAHFGSVNMRSLEIYEELRVEYEAVKEKVDVVNKEKEDIMQIINEIDSKKKRVFLKTLNSLNDIFTRNFSELSPKGPVFLDLENKKEPFEGGVSIINKVGHGKYADVTSLSGGEQTLAALSLIFAIQELKPYCFYLLDEIDAALDKKNSEILSLLLKKYMEKGQYIVISHNDEVIMGATALYGVSMTDNISKVTSLKIDK
ncbi:MAG TPA: chromosome segregation SMC family protein [Candidatus Pacearchaeota archaeon]|nr:chromosome segregation SMC family protein [Candidatus Pacearchaeota archaeon]